MPKRSAINVEYEPAEAPEINQDERGRIWVEWPQLEIALTKEIAQAIISGLMLAQIVAVAE